MEGLEDEEAYTLYKSVHNREKMTKAGGENNYRSIGNEAEEIKESKSEIISGKTQVCLKYF